MMTAMELYAALLAAYGQPRWWSDDPFEVMVEAVLVQNTAWSSVLKTRAAIGDQLTPQWIAALPTEELEQWIRPCGFSKAKTSAIKGLARWYSGYGCDPSGLRNVPTQRLREELLALRGVGAETADVLLVFCFRRPSFVIDAYTRRLLARLGYAFAGDAAIRAFFDAGLPADAQLFGWYHWLILDHGIQHCRKTPACDGCPLQSRCAMGRAR